jgi:hypothetical protein
MAITRDQLFGEMYYRENGKGRRLCKCAKCGNGPMSIVAGAVADERCDECGGILWLELTPEQFASEIKVSGFLKLHSDHLSSQIGSLYEEDVESEQWNEVLKKLVEGLEGFGDEPTARWLHDNFEKHPKLIEYVLDEFYTRDFLGKARKMVERTTKLAAMIPRKTPGVGVNIYLREATRCYIAGFWESSVALSRSTLEIALKHRLKEEEGSLPLDDKFETIVENAQMSGLIDEAHRAMTKEVFEHCNDVLRGSPANEDLAERMLSNTRGVLNYIYSR